MWESNFRGELRAGTGSEQVHPEKALEEEIDGIHDAEINGMKPMNRSREEGDPMDTDDWDILRRAAEGNGLGNAAAGDLVDWLGVAIQDTTTASKMADKTMEETNEKDETTKKIDDVFGSVKVSINCVFVYLCNIISFID